MSQESTVPKQSSPRSARSRAGLLTSVAWQVNGQTTYALEGSVFNGGSTIQWLRDELGIISSAPEIDALAATVPDSGGVVVPCPDAAGNNL